MRPTLGVVQRYGPRGGTAQTIGPECFDAFNLQSGIEAQERQQRRKIVNRQIKTRIDIL